ncbi:MAG: calcium/proton exchanger [Pyrinomonadaceae bacterium]|nr:calcium/proton exchanger [Pyrinomonadaceae bacterium]MCX7640749.1 calcium/proton exchanger [Pyrinomonadaceae bacterium]MDW8304644.1 calcium/proton exchanger [Acidobacteriota bacterium]
MKSLKPSVYWLLVFVPVAFVFRFFPSLENPTMLFVFSCLAIIPLAGLMGKATEHLAEKLGEGVGGLLNATFGNAAELIIALFALWKGLEGVVKASITGAIIGNMLLVLGLSLLLGGIKFKKQEFERTAASSTATALTLAAIALLIPTVFHIVAAQTPIELGGWTPEKEQDLSLAIAIVLFITYLGTLFFSLYTHKELFIGKAMQGAIAEVGREEEKAGEHWSLKRSVITLLIATIFVAIVSEFLVGAVEQAKEVLGFTEVFVGVVIVAIVGNAAEHSSAILMAMRNKMDLSLSIALGSSLQIALFVAPILLFVSYLFGKPMNLEFTIPEVVAVLASILIVEQICSDGESNWIEGLQLLSVYVILGILFYFLPDAH